MDYYLDGDNGEWPRAVVYDLYCDTTGEDKPPMFTYEYPVLTYRCKWPFNYNRFNCTCIIVTWHTKHACPLVQTGQVCSLPKFNSTFDVRYH